MIQRTLVVLKPDTVKRGLIGEIVSRFEKLGLHLVGMKMVWVDDKLAHDHYEGIGTMITRYNEHVFKVNADYIMAGPVIAMVREGVNIIEVVRKVAGATDPSVAAPGTIRGDYSSMTRDYSNPNNGWLTNLLHASANTTEADQEIALWFGNAEIHEHEMEAKQFKRGHK